MKPTVTPEYTRGYSIRYLIFVFLPYAIERKKKCQINDISGSQASKQRSTTFVPVSPREHARSDLYTSQVQELAAKLWSRLGLQQPPLVVPQLSTVPLLGKKSVSCMFSGGGGGEGGGHDGWWACAAFFLYEYVSFTELQLGLPSA